MEDKALIVVDVQKAFEDKKWGKRNNPEAEENISKLLGFWRENGWKVIFIQHLNENPQSVFHPGGEGFKIKEIVRPLDHEQVLTKTVNSAFIGTDLEDILRTNELNTVVITGLTTQHCVSTTARMSGNLGFRTYLVSDAIAAFELYDHNGKHYSAEEVHDVSLATLHEEFATILTTEQLIAHFGQ
jgi:nicotinamidase-related amidase